MINFVTVRDCYISGFSGDPANVVSNGYDLYVDGEIILG